MRKVGSLDAKGRERVQTINKDASMTVQSDAHLADIQNILKSYGQEGMAQLDETALIYKDVSEFTDLADALNQAAEAEIEFMKLPSKVREIFDHDVATWLDTSFDEDKRDALVEAGFLEPIPVVETGSEGGAKGTSGEKTPVEGSGTEEESTEGSE